MNGADVAGLTTRHLKPPLCRSSIDNPCRTRGIHQSQGALTLLLTPLSVSGGPIRCQPVQRLGLVQAAAATLLAGIGAPGAGFKELSPD